MRFSISIFLLSTIILLVTCCIVISNPRSSLAAELTLFGLLTLSFLLIGVIMMILSDLSPTRSRMAKEFRSRLKEEERKSTAEQSELERKSTAERNELEQMKADIARGIAETKKAQARETIEEIFEKVMTDKQHDALKKHEE